MKLTVKIFAWVIIGFIIIQFIPVDKKNPIVDRKENFVEVYKSPSEVVNIMKNSCYDCHSYETKYPAYSSFAPISWSIKHHINKGRKHANFSIWETYTLDLKKSILKKSIISLEDRKMPLPAYINYHEEANLSIKEREILLQYYKKILKEIERN